MPSRPLTLAVAAFTVAFLSGCAAPHSLDATPPEGVPTPTATETYGVATDENVLVVRTGSDELRLATMSEAEMFEDPPAGIPTIAGDEVFVFVRAAGWPLFVEQLADVPGGCGPRAYEPSLSELGGGWWKVAPVGPAGEYTMRLSAASGPGLPPGGEVGMVAAYVGWKTTTGTVVPATANLDVSIFPGEPGRIIVTVAGMSTSPEIVTGAVRVTDDAGVSSTVTLATPDDDNCIQPGDLFLVGEMAAGEQDALEDHSFTFDVTLNLDGTIHRATGVTETNGSALEFSPALP